MAKSKDDLVYVKWYPSDFIGSTAVQSMDADQVGAYCLLLNHLYMNGGRLPNDDTILAKLSKMGKKWATRGAIVKGQLVLDQTGNLTHPRVASELQEYEAQKAKRASAGAAGANIRWQSHSNRIAIASESDGKPIANSWQNDGIPEARSHSQINSIDNPIGLSPSPDGDGIPTDGTAKPKTSVERPKKEGELGPRDETGFPEFWEKYPRKEGKAPALKAWLKIRNIDTRRAAYNGLLRWLKYWETNGTERQYIPHAATWLNQSRWSDELTISNTNTPLTGSNAQGGRFAAQTPSVLPVAKGMTPGGVVIT